ncbi:biofilm development regulator YmgB/AriR family protein [Erwinia sp. 9145]|uniref:biofilm development regulator YmgB/AriR family protein n=1 Tax=Erwinia sp. 9145 TaxID=1500895 RepID=UPI00068C8282|nr:biofilm development regulator YmgB/AriR family protein [Erwinia sp. 9145]
MGRSLPGAGRAITDYFNSPAFHTPNVSELLAAVMIELMRDGRPATNKAIVSIIIARLEGEVDEARLNGYRNLLAQVMDEKQASRGVSHPKKTRTRRE